MKIIQKDDCRLTKKKIYMLSVIADGDTTVDSTSAIDSTSTGLDSSIVIQDNNLKPKTKRKRATDFRCNILGCSM